MSVDRIIEIGGISARLRVGDPQLQQAVDAWFSSFFTANPSAEPLDLTLNVDPELACVADDHVSVEWRKGRWVLERADFRAEWFPDSRCGSISQDGPFYYPLDSVLRIVLSFLLAPQGGFLMHAASAVRNGQAFVFTGVSGAGKTTISRLAPPDADVLTDEISYVRPVNGSYWAFGTPFAGNLGVSGKNTSAPLKAVYLLSQGAENRIEALSQKQIVKALMRNFMFFAKDSQSTAALFETACRIAACVPVRRLIFTPTTDVWEIIA